MSRDRARLLPLAAVILAAGQGAMLLAGGRGAAAPGLLWPVLFLLLTVALAVLVAGPLGARRVPPPPRSARTLALLGLAVLMALGVWSALRRSSPLPEDVLVGRVDSRLDAAAAILDRATTALDALLEEAVISQPAADGPFTAATEASTWQRRWRELGVDADLLPLEIVVWQRGQRATWTAGALPLGDPRSDPGRDLQRNRGIWVLRDHVARGGEQLVFQVRLDPERLARRWQGLRLLPGEVPAPDEGTAVRTVVLGNNEAAPRATLVSGAETEMMRLRSRDAGRYVAALLAWSVVVLALAWMLGGSTGALAAAWIARLLAAAVDLHQWVAVAWPSTHYPAPPESPASLVDPAYFATPFAGGLFASAADVLVTGLLLAITAMHLLRRWRRADAPGGGLLHAAVTGVVAGGALLACRAMVTLLAENANARFIGAGIPVGFLSFWILHAARLLLGFAPLALVAGVVAGRRRPAGWRDTLAVAVVAALVLAVAGVPVPLVLGGAAGAAVLWLAAPLLGSASLLNRRLVWPVVLVVASLWNYGVLREVYGAAERSWLEGKSGLIATADVDWNRFLLADLLTEMMERDHTIDTAAGIWRDEPAWRLWRDSALRDLGLPCLLELQDPAGDGVSLHTTGFLGDFQYEVSLRTPWVDALGQSPDGDTEAIFQTERRLYHGGEEEVLIGEIPRQGDRGWLRVEIPVRSWRISTLLDQLAGNDLDSEGGYRPRAEIDREITLWRADDGGLRDAGPAGFPGPTATGSVAALRGGEVPEVQLEADRRQWLCVWAPLSDEAARTPGEGFILGLRQNGRGETLLDLSRLLLLDLLLFGFGLGLRQVLRLAARRLGAVDVPEPWRPGFQERFVGSSFFIGLVLLVLLGSSVDRVSQERIRGEARVQTGAGLSQAVDQLRSLLVEQARALAASEYIGDLLVGELAGGRPLGPIRLQQGMVFDADGNLLLDETLSDLTPDEASSLLDAARRSPLVIMREGETSFVGAVIPIDLGGVMSEVALESGYEPGDAYHTGGFFLYRQRLDSSLLSSLAALVRGELLLRVDGVPVLASDPGRVFSGGAPLLAEPALMGSVSAHPEGINVFVDPRRPFAPTGCQSMPVFGRDAGGELVPRRLPGTLEVVFPDRARLFEDQRRTTTLFLAGLANLVLLAALSLAVLMSWNIFRPLRLLMGATRSLARGDYAAPLPGTGRDEVGQLSDAFARMRDDLHGAQEDLAARERFLSAVLDRVTVGVAVFAGEGTVVALNPAGRQILGEFAEGDDESAAVDLLARFRSREGGGSRHGGELRSPDGARTLRGALAPMDTAEGRADTMLVFEDVTDFLENQRQAINAELARQVAHEIKNPLTPIQLSAQLLHQAWRDGHPQLERIMEDGVARILDQVELLRRIAGEFSLLGRPGDLTVEPVDLRDAVQEITTAYTGGTTADTPLVDLAPGTPPPVLGDPDSLRKILGNFMQNSMDATPAGRPATVEVDWQVDDEMVTLRWRDRGVGIPAEVAGRLFDPYFSTKSKGTGLGLAICRNLTERMGGRISLTDREDGPGAVATLALRRADQGKDSA